MRMGVTLDPPVRLVNFCSLLEHARERRVAGDPNSAALRPPLTVPRARGTFTYSTSVRLAVVDGPGKRDPRGRFVSDQGGGR
jgi:hypothetical protein